MGERPSRHDRRYVLLVGSLAVPSGVLLVLCQAVVTDAVGIAFPFWPPVTAVGAVALSVALVEWYGLAPASDE